MSTAGSDILSAALSLPENERASIAFELLHSLRPPGIMNEDDPGFLTELERRAEAFDRDPSIGMPWEEVDRQIRQELKNRRKS